MSTLYISDLDGTLLNPQAEVDEVTVRALNELIAQGLPFTIATARTWETVGKMFKNVSLRIPVILQNGACMKDPVTGKYLMVERIPLESTKAVIRAMKRVGVHGFMYQIQEDQLNTYYEALDTPWLQEFYETRRKKYDKRFLKVDDFYQQANEEISYFSIFNTKDKMDPIYEALKEDPGLTLTYYRDIYSEDLWYLEILKAGASKAKAVKTLKETLGYDSLVVFGDNFNDLPMFEQADQAIAVANAVPAVKDQADRVIGSNKDHGVIEYLKEVMHGSL